MGRVSRERRKFLDYPANTVLRIKSGEIVNPFADQREVDWQQKSFLCLRCGAWGPREEWHKHRCKEDS